MFLAIKELMHNKTRFLMLAIIFVLVSWLVFILSGLGNGLASLSASTIKHMKVEYVVFEQGSQSSLSKSLLSEELVKVAAQQPNVKAAAPLGTTMATALKGQSEKDEDKLDIAIIGIAPGSFLQPKIVEGEGLSGDKPTGVLVNISMKDEGFSIGDTFKLDGSTESLTIVGYVNGETYNHVASVFTPIDEWRKIAFAAPGSDNGVAEPINAVMLQGNGIHPSDLNGKLPNTNTVNRAAAIQGMPGYKEESGSITMMLAFLLTISAFVLGVFFYVLTLQKSNQFGIMKAIGARNGFLAKAIISQVLLLSVGSILIGILLTYAAATVLPQAMPFILSTRLVVIYAIVLVIIALLSSLVSVRKITKVDPLKALGRVE
ncbi:ABC transporter permease [Cohnella faecalis]|uniref:Putative hemin transport system permease protein HrtB n=1 Tax=Cohnella faecalis TaxID=2315694 RepID=A0A398CGE9_9BACL|nr:ABC transporter permease [Cohnella faecalis]RIE01535.1 ABC transporter permease [Cohnella faecalis]